MTAPDVAALAAALDSPPYVIDDFEAEAQRILAALAAQGWRITSAPDLDAIRRLHAARWACSEDRDSCDPDANPDFHRAQLVSSEPSSAQASSGSGSTSASGDQSGSRSPASHPDPVSAQAAPDTDTAKLKGRWEAWLAEKQRIEQAAVRAALDGLRAVVMTDMPGNREKAYILALIDARLAALDA